MVGDSNVGIFVHRNRVLPSFGFNGFCVENGYQNLHDDVPLKHDYGGSGIIESLGEYIYICIYIYKYMIKELMHKESHWGPSVHKPKGLSGDKSNHGFA